VSITSTPLVAYKINPEHTVPVPRPLDCWTIEAQRSDIPAALQAKIRALLSDSSAFPLGRGARCFVPHLAFTCGGGKHLIEIIICTHCNEVLFWSNGSGHVTTLSDEARSEFDAIQNELFPP